MLKLQDLMRSHLTMSHLS